MNIKEDIGLVEKWIADPKSVGQEELKAARDAARVLRGAARDAAAVAAANAALYGNIDDAKVWVAEYRKSLSE
tara:strand:+ start:1500 stop:1718 length:219 start_codon:yes stop_codon:yes gene_type:complete